MYLFTYSSAIGKCKYLYFIKLKCRNTTLQAHRYKVRNALTGDIVKK